MFTHSASPIDPNVQRVLETSIAICNDVDQRLRLLRLGIAESFPQLAPLALAGVQGVHTGLSLPLGGVSGQIPTGVFAGGSPYANLAATQLLGNLGALGSLGSVLPTGTNFQNIGLQQGLPGVTIPSGVGFPFRLY